MRNFKHVKHMQMFATMNINYYLYFPAGVILLHQIYVRVIKLKLFRDMAFLFKYLPGKILFI